MAKSKKSKNLSISVRESFRKSGASHNFEVMRQYSNHNPNDMASNLAKSGHLSLR